MHAAGVGQTVQNRRSDLRHVVLPQHRGIWVEPELMAEIEYRAKCAEGKVRHPFFKGLREHL
jgi:ATP-dependent DNA ligase